MITRKYIHFGIMGMLLVLVWMIQGPISEYLHIEFSKKLLAVSENDTDTESATSENNTSISMAKYNETSMNSTLTKSDDINGSLTTLIPEGPQGVEDRRHAPS